MGRISEQGLEKNCFNLKTSGLQDKIDLTSFSLLELRKSSEAKCKITLISLVQLHVEAK
jgi:hypothetical protein